MTIIKAFHNGNYIEGYSIDLERREVIGIRGFAVKGTSSGRLIMVPAGSNRINVDIKDLIESSIKKDQGFV